MMLVPLLRVRRHVYPMPARSLLSHPYRQAARSIALCSRSLLLTFALLLQLQLLRLVRRRTAIISRRCGRHLKPMAHVVALSRNAVFPKPQVARIPRPRPCTATYKVTFNIPKEGRQETIPCDDATYILDAVEASGVDLGFDCTAGGCANCAGRVLSGVVDQSDQMFLSDNEIANGLAMLCTSIPKSDCVIEIRREHCCS